MSLCEGSGSTVYPGTQRSFSGGEVFCGYCNRMVATVGISNPYRPERRIEHNAHSSDITKGAEDG